MYVVISHSLPHLRWSGAGYKMVPIHLNEHYLDEHTVGISNITKPLP